MHQRVLAFFIQSVKYTHKHIIEVRSNDVQPLLHLFYKQLNLSIAHGSKRNKGQFRPNECINQDA